MLVLVAWVNCLAQNQLQQSKFLAEYPPKLWCHLNCGKWQQSIDLYQFPSKFLSLHTERHFTDRVCSTMEGNVFIGVCPQAKEGAWVHSVLVLSGA